MEHIMTTFIADFAQTMQLDVKQTTSAFTQRATPQRIQTLWTGSKPTSVRSPRPSQIHTTQPARRAQSIDTQVVDDEYDGKTCNELKILCKELSVATTGKKSELIARIRKAQTEAGRLEGNQVKFYLDDESGHFVNHESGLIYDNADKCVIGHQSIVNKTVELLHADDIKFCRDNNLQWNPGCVAVTDCNVTTTASDPVEEDIQSEED